MLKNGVGRYNIFFFYFYTKLAESSFLCRFRIESVNDFFFFQFHDSICAMCFLLQQTILHMRKCFPEWVHCQVVWILHCKHWILYWIQENKTVSISFVLGYLRMILWKFSTAISIKHLILANFNKIKKIQFWQPVCL